MNLGSTNLTLAPHGTSSGNTFEMRFLELAANGGQYIAFKAPDSIASSYTYVLPSGAPSAGQLLSAAAPVGGVVTLSWATDQTAGAGSSGITSLNGLTTSSQSVSYTHLTLPTKRIV